MGNHRPYTNNFVHLINISIPNLKFIELEVFKKIQSYLKFFINERIEKCQYLIKIGTLKKQISMCFIKWSLNIKFVWFLKQNLSIN